MFTEVEGQRNMAQMSTKRILAPRPDDVRVRVESAHQGRGTGPGYAHNKDRAMEKPPRQHPTDDIQHLRSLPFPASWTEAA